MTLTAKIALSLLAALLLILFAVPAVVFLTLAGLLLGLLSTAVSFWAVVILYENRWSGGDPSMKYREAFEVAAEDALRVILRALRGPKKTRRSIGAVIAGLPWALYRARVLVVFALLIYPLLALFQAGMAIVTDAPSSMRTLRRYWSDGL